MNKTFSQGLIIGANSFINGAILIQKASITLYKSGVKVIKE